MKIGVVPLGLLALLSVVNCQLNGMSKQLATIDEPVTCSVSLHAVTVTWNGTRITGPVLIYHDEISVDLLEPWVTLLHPVLWSVHLKLELELAGIVQTIYFSVMDSKQLI